MVSAVERDNTMEATHDHRFRSAGLPGGSVSRALLVALAVLLAVASAFGEERILFSNSLAPMPARVSSGLKNPTAAQLAQRVEIQIPLRMRGYAKLVNRIGRGEAITHASLDQEHLPAAADYDALVAWLKAEGLTITRTDPNRLSVFVSGTVAQIQQSLQVQMAHVTLEGHEYHVARTHPSLPVRIAGQVLGINGLQPYTKMIKRSTTTPNAPPYLVNEMLGAYNARNLGVTGAGQKIAILIDTVPLNSDLTTFWTNNNIAQSLANIEEVNVNNATLGAPTGEETLDVEWSSGVAPGAKIRVYAAGSLAFTDLDKALQAIISDLPSQPQLHQLSISLGLGETYLTSSSQMQTDAQYFATLAGSGVSVFVSSGDAGSNPNNSGATGGPLQVEYYASDPSVTGVGGTTLNLNTSTGAVTSETAWSGSGGGVSVVFSRPSWQTGAGVPSGNFRLVPDVCLAANPSTGAYVYLNGAVQQFGGTSWSSPSWAGFCALINEARAKVSKGPIGLLNPSIYPLIGTSNFRDITSGSNGTYSAAAGYDRVTGIGSPNVSVLLQTLTTPSPVIASFSPSYAQAGGSVIITGSYFTSATAVGFNGTNATTFSVDSDSQITVTVPTGASTGPISVTTAGGLTSSTGTFTFLPSNIANDLFSFAQAISGGSGTVAGTNAGATKETGEPNHAGNAGGASVWYAWTAPAGGGVYTFDTLGSSFDTLLAVYTGTSVSALTPVVSNDDAGSSVTSAVSFVATGGTTYYVAVDGHGGAGGNVVLNWTANTGAPTLNSFSPASGNVGTVVVINGANYTGTTNVSFHGASAAFTVVSATQINATAPVGVSSGPITVTTPNGSITSTTSFVYVAVPLNDSFASATDLGSSDGTFVGYNVGASKETGEPSHAGNAGGASVWWRWVAPSSGQYTVSTQGSSFDTLLGVYTGTAVSALTTVASNDNDPGGGVTSALTLTATAGTVYHFAVDGSGGATGNIVLTLNPISTSSVLYSTGFETSEGFATTGSLTGQQGWVSIGSGGNTVSSNNADFSSQGQQARVGLTSPSGTDTGISVWQPLSYTPATGEGITFSVLTDIFDSTNRRYDLFRWEVWNLAGQRLFSLEFNNQTNAISYILDDGLGAQATSATLANSHVYALVMTMDFAHGTWSASLDGSTIVASQPMTTTGAALTLSGVRANWTKSGSRSGNNYMLFDNYKVTRTSLVPPHFNSQPVGVTVQAGSNVTFSASAAGTPVINYQWRLGGSSISHATSASYSIFGVQSTDAGTYDLLASNAAGSATSQPASLTVKSGYDITTSSLPAAGGTTSGSGNYASAAAVSVIASAASGYQFQSWTEGGAVVSTSATYNFTASADRALVANFQQLPHAAWKSQWFNAAELADPTVSGDNADPDGDGLSNLVEYALGLNPRVPNSPAVLHSAIENGSLTVTYVRSRAATDVTIIIEDSADLLTWASGSGVTTDPVVIADDGTNQTVKVSDVLSNSTAQRFLRLRVTSP